MLLRYLFNLRFGERGEIRNLGGDNSLERHRMMGLQILAKESDGAALARGMADEDDRFSVDKIHGDFLVIGVFLWNMITLVMGFFPVDQMMLESEGIIRFDGDFVLRATAAEIVVNMGCTMIDDHNHSSDLVCFFWFSKGLSFFEEPAQL